VLKDTKADQDLIDLWLAGRPRTTRLAYASDIQMLRLFANKPLSDLQCEDLMRFACGLAGTAATRARRIATVKSLFGFATRLGVRTENPALVLKCLKAEGCVHERILDEDEVAAVISEAAPGRDRCLSTLAAAQPCNTCPSRRSADPFGSEFVGAPEPGDDGHVSTRSAWAGLQSIPSASCLSLRGDAGYPPIHEPSGSRITPLVTL